MSLVHAARVAGSNGSYKKWPFGCVVKKGGAVQAVGRNILKCDPTYLDNHSNCSVHAEVDALRQMGYQARGCVMFVARLTKAGRPALAEPCDECKRVIAEAGVKKVVFTQDDGRPGYWDPRTWYYVPQTD